MAAVDPTVSPKPKVMHPFRICIVDDGVASVPWQRGVNSTQEQVTAAQLSEVVGRKAPILWLTSSQRSIHDPGGFFTHNQGPYTSAQPGASSDSLPSSPVPLMPASHQLRPVCGPVRVEGRGVSVATLTAAYTPVFAGLFGREWSKVLQQHGEYRPALMQIPIETAFTKRAREAFLPRSTVAVIQPSEHRKLQIESGRELEASAIFDRERFADTVRRAEPVVGREDFEKSGSVRVALMEDQWTTPETLAICMELSRSSEALRLTSEGSVAKKTPSYRWATDRVLEIAVRQSKGEAAFVPVIPNAGGPHVETSWQTFFFQIGHLGPTRRRVDRRVGSGRRVGFKLAVFKPTRRRKKGC